MPRPRTTGKLLAARIGLILLAFSGMTRGQVDVLLLAQEKRTWREAWRRVRHDRAVEGARRALARMGGAK